jgi:hypothetical protein
MSRTKHTGRLRPVLQRRTLTIALSACLAGATFATTAVAQRGPRHQRTAARSDCVENALRQRERLALTDEQVVQLNALRASCIAQRQAESSAVMKLQSDLAAGEITREQFRDAMPVRRDTTAASAKRAQLAQILSEDQLAQVNRAQRGSARAGRAGVRGTGRAQFRGRDSRGLHGHGRMSFRDNRRPGIRGRDTRFRFNRRPIR